MKQQQVQGWGAWIGLERRSDNAFYQIDDTPLTGQYTAWADGEPNNLDEKCVHTFNELSRPRKWNDNFCDLPQSDMWKAPVVLCKTGKNI